MRDKKVKLTFANLKSGQTSQMNFNVYLKILVNITAFLNIHTFQHFNLQHKKLILAKSNHECSGNNLNAKQISSTFCNCVVLESKPLLMDINVS